MRRESITSQIRKALFEAAAQPRLEEYLLDRYARDENTFDSVDWDATHSSIRSLSNPEHLFIAKFFFEQLPVGTRLKQRESLIPADCHACDEPSEYD